MSEIRWAKNAAYCLGIILCNPLSFFSVSMTETIEKSFSYVFQIWSIFVFCTVLQFHYIYKNLCLSMSYEFLHNVQYSSVLRQCSSVSLFDRVYNYILISPHCYHSNFVMLSLIKCVPGWNGRNITFPVFNFEQKVELGHWQPSRGD